MGLAHGPRFIEATSEQPRLRHAPKMSPRCPNAQEIDVQSESSRSTVYFDGSCPLCRAEIGYYRRKDISGALSFIDVSKPDAVVPGGLTQRRAMERFHVRAGNGQLLSGAAAFVEVWARLPRWRWAARAAAIPGILTVLELSYRLFLPARPMLVRLFGSKAVGPTCVDHPTCMRTSNTERGCQTPRTDIASERSRKP